MYTLKEAHKLVKEVHRGGGEGSEPADESMPKAPASQSPSQWRLLSLGRNVITTVPRPPVLPNDPDLDRTPANSERLNQQRKKRTPMATDRLFEQLLKREPAPPLAPKGPYSEAAVQQIKGLSAAKLHPK